MNKYQIALEERTKKQLLRQLPTDMKGIDFYSNDYLGFATNQVLFGMIEEEMRNIAPKQAGASGSRLLSGNNPYVEALERYIADFHEVEAALVFNSGYTANVGLLSCIAAKEDTLIMDELIHASLIDGARLSKATRVRFQHNDLADLATKLRAAKGNKLVVVESVYSMDGDICPLLEMHALCENYNAKLIVDEAHGIGVFGEKGAGLVHHLGLQHEVFATVVTYGKALGAHGAAILGKQWLKDYLVNFSRPFIFTTAPSIHQLATLFAAYSYLPKVNKSRQKLQSLIAYLNNKKQATCFNWLPSNTAIQSVIIPGNEAVMKAAKHLQANGIAAMGIRYPSVARGKERIRICLHSFNTEKEIDYLIAQLILIEKQERLGRKEKEEKVIIPSLGF
jgi:8-amino-7-oxononanoate synthase